MNRHIRAMTENTIGKITASEETEGQQLFFGDIDPKLDISKPSFDMAAFKKAMQSMAEAIKKLKPHLGPITDSISGFIDVDPKYGEAKNAIAAFLQHAIDAISSPIDDIDSPETAKLEEARASIAEWITDENAQNIAVNLLLMGYIANSLQPHFMDELSAVLGNLNKSNLSDLVQDDNSGENALIETLKRALAKRDTQTVIEALPRLKAVNPKKRTSPNNRLANELQHDLIGAGPVELVVANRGKKNEVTAYTVATIETDEGVTIKGKPYSEYDRQVHDAVISLWLYGDKSRVITPDMVYRAMNGLTSSEKVSPQAKAAVTRSLEKMRTGIRIFCDATEELKKRGTTLNGKPVSKFEIDGFLLPLKKVSVKAGKDEVTAFMILDEPILLTYSKMTNQLLTGDAAMLDIKEVGEDGKALPVSVSNSESRTAIKGYLWRRVQVMKRDRKNKVQNQSDVILFDTLFTETDQKSDNRMTNMRNRDYVFLVLDYWKATGFIRDYEKQHKGKTTTGIKIII